MYLVDSHCHLNLLDPTVSGDVESVIKRAQDAEVRSLLNVCVSLESFPTILKIAEPYSFVSLSAGCHPNEQKEIFDATQLLTYAQEKKVVAIGETGLDYFRSSGDLSWQQDRFRAHIQVAKKLHKPLIIHTRAAKDDTIRLMQAEQARDVGGVMHCFTEDELTAKRALDLDFYISFSGIVTFKNAKSLQEVAKKIPLDRMLIETDSPYLAPNPHRGQPNEPAYVRHTASFLADLLHIDLEEFAEQTTQNFFKLFSGALRQNV